MKVGKLSIPDELYFNKEHAWVRQEAEDMVTIGITDYAQYALRRIKFIYLPKVGSLVKCGDVVGTVESVKAISEIYSPVAGKIVDVNTKLVDGPESLNEDPYRAGWVAKLRATDLQEGLRSLQTSGQYARYVRGLLKIDKNLLAYRWKRH